MRDDTVEGLAFTVAVMGGIAVLVALVFGLRKLLNWMFRIDEQIALLEEIRTSVKPRD